MSLKDGQNFEGAVSKAKIFIRKYAGKLEFQDGCEGGGLKAINLLWGRYVYFVEHYIIRWNNQVMSCMLAFSDVNRYWSSCFMWSVARASLGST